MTTLLAAIAWCVICVDVTQAASWGHYKTLSIDETASPQDIGKAFRRLSLKHHPDKNPNDDNALARFAKLTVGGLYKSNPGDPQLESTRFHQPLKLNVNSWFQAFAFRRNLVPLHHGCVRRPHRGAVQAESSVIHRLKAPGFNP